MPGKWRSIMYGKTMALWIAVVAGILVLTGCDALNRLNMEVPGAAKPKAPAPAKPVYRLPFGVKVAGQEARVVGNDDVFGRVADPVSADAAVEVALRADQVIINAFPTDK